MKFVGLSAGSISWNGEGFIERTQAKEERMKTLKHETSGERGTDGNVEARERRRKRNG